MGASDTTKHHASFGGTLQKAWQHVRPKKRNREYLNICINCLTKQQL